MPSRSYLCVSVVTIETRTEGTSERSLAVFTERARVAAGLNGRVSVLVTSDRRIRRLNRLFCGKDQATDVLAFPASASVAHRIAGDIAVSARMAAANAQRLGHSPAEELRILVLHGILHLAGYDHESDGDKMARREEQLRRKLGLPDGLIARSRGGVAPGLSGRGGAGERPNRTACQAGRRR